MPTVRSSGILLYRRTPDSALDVWIAHMGGPFWSRKDRGAWSIPKGEIDPGVDDDELAAAKREFTEEIGTPPPDAHYVKLGEFVQPSRKIVIAFAAETDFVVDAVVSNTFSVEWPPRSGSIREFPEIDDARWFSIPEARGKLTKGQLPVLDALEKRLGSS